MLEVCEYTSLLPEQMSEYVSLKQTLPLQGASVLLHGDKKYDPVVLRDFLLMSRPYVSKVSLVRNETCYVLRDYIGLPEMEPFERVESYVDAFANDEEAMVIFVTQK